MSKKVDAAAFVQNERANEFSVTFEVTGEIRMTINADSLEDAKAKATAMMLDDDFGHELDTVDEARVSYVQKSRPMYLVTRGDAKMQVSHLQPGDQPRSPDERGF